ncbi:hypothetical protein JNJ66_07550 [Candidatus Saccharibacteria bacterium]|nr:hypothetical protein [Candidatus Saccharibacteria bacterium]
MSGSPSTTLTQQQRSRLINQAMGLVEGTLGAHMRAHQLGDRWLLLARSYARNLLTGRNVAGRIRLDSQSRDVVRRAVHEARILTDLPQPAGSAKKRTPRRTKKRRN